MFEIYLSFSDMFSVFTDWLNIVLSATTLCVAIYALNSWKNEKVYDIDTAAISLVSKLYVSMLNTLDINVNFNLLTDQQRVIHEETAKQDNINASWIAAFYVYKNRLDDFKLADAELSEISIKVMRYSKDKELIELYRFWYSVQSNLKPLILSYFTDNGKRRLNQLGQLGDVAYDLSEEEFDRMSTIISDNFIEIRNRFTELAASVYRKFINRII